MMQTLALIPQRKLEEFLVNAAGHLLSLIPILVFDVRAEMIYDVGFSNRTRKELLGRKWLFQDCTLHINPWLAKWLVLIAPMNLMASLGAHTVTEQELVVSLAIRCVSSTIILVDDPAGYFEVWTGVVTRESLISAKLLQLKHIV